MEKTPIVVKVLLILYIFSLDTETCRAAFTFTLNVISHSTNFNCLGDDLDAPCETFFLQFCLRERRSSSSPDASDCPLGTAGRLDGASGTKMIQSNQPWQVSTSYRLFNIIAMHAGYIATLQPLAISFILLCSTGFISAIATSI